jgi:hypothetical protein
VRGGRQAGGNFDRRAGEPAGGGAVTEPTNYTKLNKKSFVKIDNLANLSSYNPVVHKTIKDFKPTNIQTKIVQV